MGLQNRPPGVHPAQTKTQTEHKNHQNVTHEKNSSSSSLQSPTKNLVRPSHARTRETTELTNRKGKTSFIKRSLRNIAVKCSHKNDEAKDLGVQLFS